MWIEKTTVTKKVRRIAHFDLETVRQAILWNGPDEIVLTFLNYIYPDLWAATTIPRGHLAWRYILALEEKLNLPVVAATTDPLPQHQISTQ